MSILTSLKYYWRINLAVLLAAAIATTVLTGALLVGDSVRGSLRDLTLDRLGEIDYALLSQKFLRESLVTDMEKNPGFEKLFDAVAPAIVLNGTSVHTKTKARATQINIYAIDERFLSFFETHENVQSNLKKKAGQIFPSIVINESLQKELRAEIGDQILLYFEKPGDIARASILGRKDTEDVIETSRFVLTQIIPDRGVGRFGIRPHQALPPNAFVQLSVMQKDLEQKGLVNALFVSQKSDAEKLDLTSELQSQLKSQLDLEDLGLQFHQLDDVLLVESKESILSPQLVELSQSVASELKAPTLTTYTYLANTMEAKDNILPYSTVAALNTAVGAPFGSLKLQNGLRASNISDEEILINKWAANDLQVTTGDFIEMSYFAVGARDELFTRRAKFKVAGVVRMSGLAADRELTPEYPGIADADNMADWDPPFPVDLSLIRPKDENYWDQYRGTPKAFVSENTGKKLWGSRFGNVTGLRVGAAANTTLAETHDLFKKKLKERIVPEQFDFAFQPVKKQGLASSSGATDFSGLFIGFSLFLIVSGAILVGLLFRLGVEQRAKEIGTRLAVGYPIQKVRRQFLTEGGLIAVLGALLGIGGAIFYAWLMMVGLRTWWVAAVGSPFLFLHINPISLIMGFGISILVILVSIWLGIRKLSKIPPPALLAGVTVPEREIRSGKKAKVVAYAALFLAGALTGLAFSKGASAATGLFFGVGTLLLIAGLAFFTVWLNGLHKAVTNNTGLTTISRMAVRNSPRNPSRSLLSAALVACACFSIVSVEAFRQDFGSKVLDKESGAGGYTLVAQSDIPLQYDLNSDEGRLDLGFADEDSKTLQQSQITPFRYLHGDDASCLNLYQVEKPRILGVTKEQIERGGFRFQQISKSANDATNPWTLLNTSIETNVIPTFGDYNSVKWILHSAIDKDIVITDEFGQEIKLRFVGLLNKSIFQSELLISEENFLKHFPSQSGYSYFLIQTPPGQVVQSAQILEKTLSDYGFDSTTTNEKLANFQAVENTYLSTFQTLGGLGLILGTFGLGMLLIRNVIERRGELATLRAFGYRRSILGFLVLAENAFLLALGILVGSVSALIAVAPHLLSGASQVPWGPLALTLLIVFLVGMLSSSAAVRTALRIPLLSSLKAE